MKNIGSRWVKQIETSDSIAEWIPFVSEIAAGSRMKYALDKRSGQLCLHRAMADGVHYPTNYGFVPRTISGEDGEELDVMAISTEPLLPLTVAHVRVVGGCTIRCSADGASEDKLLGVVLGDPDVEKINDLHDVDRKLKDKIEGFFTSYKQSEGDTVAVEQWFDRLTAVDKLKASFKAARKKTAK